MLTPAKKKIINRCGMQPDKMPGIQGFFRSVRQELRWLAPGIGVKRWLIPLLIGTTLVALGLTMVALDIYRNAPETLQPILSLLSLQELDRGIRVIVFSLVGVGLILYSVIGFNRSLLKPFMRPDKPIVDAVSSYRRKEKGPRVVVIGGGDRIVFVAARIEGIHPQPDRNSDGGG